tara:strand:+ start:1416 stop:1667 length:252 start_codon:yes stop_codon:yes gene_type:complete
MEKDSKLKSGKLEMMDGLIMSTKTKRNPYPPAEKEEVKEEPERVMIKLVDPTKNRPMKERPVKQNVTERLKPIEKKAKVKSEK